MWDLNSLKHLKVNFIHSDGWLRDAARIANHCYLVEDICLRLQLFESSWAEYNASLSAADWSMTS